MVVTDSDMISQVEVESAMQQSSREHQTVRSIGRQLSIYSLTLDEFQNTLSDNGKSFGSMNMDEFLNSIWTAEENQAQGHNAADAALQFPLREGNAPAYKGIAKQPSIPRQGSFSIPEPLCRKTVEEVWSEIQKDRQHGSDGHGRVQNPNTTQKQPTFGEMTLEDFLVRAGVVRAQNLAAASASQQALYGMYQNSSNPGMAPSFGARPIMAMGSSGGGIGSVNVATAPYQGVPQSGVYPSGMKLGEAYTQKPSGMSYGGRMGNGSGGFGQGQASLEMGSPVSPVADNQVDDSQYGMDSGGMRGGRKRIVDGPVEKVVERRQRRMIKNRESAARSRARKQAYTVELEAELNQLKEENQHLKQALAESERKRDQQYHEEMRAKAQAQSKADKAIGKLKAMRRTSSCAY